MKNECMVIVDVFVTIILRLEMCVLLRCVKLINALTKTELVSGDLNELPLNTPPKTIQELVTTINTLLFPLPSLYFDS